jgi:hypothetical protein
VIVIAGDFSNCLSQLCRLSEENGERLI